MKVGKVQFIVAIIIMFFSFFLVIVSYYNFQLSAVNPADSEDIIIEVPKGTTVKGIGKILHKEGFIRDEFIFNVYVKLNNVTNLQAGYYKLSKNMSLPEIIEKIKSGDAVFPDMIKITFPEGFNLEQIATRVSEHTINQKEDFMRIATDKEYIDELIDKYWFLTSEIKNKNIRYALEGYLFPSTYYFENNKVTPKVIIEKMLDQMDFILSKYKEEISASKYSLHEILTLASIIEYEAIFEEDRYMISGVFYNRLNNNMKFESCVTACYAAKVDGACTPEKVKKISKNEHPYNTYQVTGLPPGPINMPGESVIHAALNPASHDYFFFMADIYDTQQTFYSKTLDEHEEKVNKYLKNR